jgi:hypothetical protein
MRIFQNIAARRDGILGPLSVHVSRQPIFNWKCTEQILRRIEEFRQKVSGTWVGEKFFEDLASAKRLYSEIMGNINLDYFLVYRVA